MGINDHNKILIANRVSRHSIINESGCRGKLCDWSLVEESPLSANSDGKWWDWRRKPVNLDDASTQARLRNPLLLLSVKQEILARAILFILVFVSSLFITSPSKQGSLFRVVVDPLSREISSEFGSFIPRNDLWFLVQFIRVQTFESGYEILLDSWTRWRRISSSVLNCRNDNSVLLRTTRIHQNKESHVSQISRSAEKETTIIVMSKSCHPCFGERHFRVVTVFIIFFFIAVLLIMITEVKAEKNDENVVMTKGLQLKKGALCGCRMEVFVEKSKWDDLRFFRRVISMIHVHCLLLYHAMESLCLCGVSRSHHEKRSTVSCPSLSIYWANIKEWTCPSIWYSEPGGSSVQEKRERKGLCCYLIPFSWQLFSDWHSIECLKRKEDWFILADRDVETVMSVVNVSWNGRDSLCHWHTWDESAADILFMMKNETQGINEMRTPKGEERRWQS